MRTTRKLPSRCDGDVAVLRVQMILSRRLPERPAQQSTYAEVLRIGRARVGRAFAEEVITQPLDLVHALMQDREYADKASGPAFSTRSSLRQGLRSLPSTIGTP